MPDEQRYREVERRLWGHVGLTPVEQRISLAGVGVRVQIAGDGPPVVLIHGGPNAGSTWALLTIPDDVFPSVSAPTLFLWGEDDPFGTAAVARHVVELMPHASLRMLPASGHLPWVDDPQGTGRATTAFLRATD